MKVLPAEGGGQWVFVPPDRLDGWLGRFGERHGALTWTAHGGTVIVTSADGATATCTVPFPPLRVVAEAPWGGLVAHSRADRRVGVLLVRLGGYAVGVFDGSRLVLSKVGSRQVHGRSAAGGWSQQRFARRRQGQVDVALAAAADVAARLLLPELGRLAAVVTGGDRKAVTGVLEDRRLAPLLPLVTPHLLDVPDPRLKVLERAPEEFRAVRVLVTEVPEAPP